MKGKIGKIASISIILMTIISMISVPTINAESGTIRVPQDYPTIQGAIDAASPGDTILVSEGVYYENIRVQKALTIIGENAESTIVNGNGDFHVFYIESTYPIILHDVTIQGFTITGAGEYEGIFLGHASNCKIIGNIIRDGEEIGIWVNISSNNTIANNTVTSNRYHGIEITELCNNNTIANNTVTSNGGIGISLSGWPDERSDNNTLVNNTVESNNGDGIHIGTYSKYNTLRRNKLIGNTHQLVVSGLRVSDYIQDIDTSNLANGKPIYYWINKRNDQIPSDAGSVTLVNSTGITTTDLNIEYMKLAFTNDSIITNNSIVCDTTGVILMNSEKNIITDNSIMVRRIAIGGAIGIYMSNSNSNVIARNTFKHALDDAINPFSLYYSHDNKIYHNNFINCTRMTATDSTNILDDGYPSGGNYWLYRGISDLWDYNRDGLSDYPQGANENNKDRYPLMGMFHRFNTPLGYHVNVVSNCTIEDFQYFDSNSTIRMQISGMFGGQTHGFSRLCIPHALAKPEEISITSNKPVIYSNYTLYDNGTHRWVYLIYEFMDVTPPIITLISPENKTYNVNDVPLTFTLGESTSWIGYSLDGQTNVTISGNATLSGLSEGAHTITVYANDTIGNMGSSDIVYFTIDTTPPSISVVSPENKTYTTTNIPLTFTLDESTSWMAYSLDNQANVTITGNTTLSGLSDGSHSLIVYAEDNAGNIGASEIIYFNKETLENQQPEPFPIWIIAIVIVVLLVAALAYVIRWRKKPKIPKPTP